MKIDLSVAVQLWLFEEYPYGAINTADLFDQFCIFFFTQQYGNTQIKVRKGANLGNTFLKVLDDLASFDKVKPMRSHSTGYGYFVKKKHNNTPQELLNIIYPYGYLSHLSAMQYYDLTDKLPITVFMTFLSNEEWKITATKEHSEKVASFFPDDEVLFYLPRYPVEDEYFKKRLAFKRVKKLEPHTEFDNKLKVINIGELFIQMLQEPDLCGGFDHVLDTYNEYGKIFLKKILKSLDTASKIDQTRVCFMLDKVLELKHPKIDLIKESMQGQRGSSRKMISKEPFSSYFCLEWNISLNHYLLESYGTTNSQLGE